MKSTTALNLRQTALNLYDILTYNKGWSLICELKAITLKKNIKIDI